jgi:hypothetical protein
MAETRPPSFAVRYYGGDLAFELPFYRLRPDDHTSHSKTPMRWLTSFLDTTRAFDLFVPSRGATGTSCCGKASRSARSESKTIHPGYLGLGDEFWA